MSSSVNAAHETKYLSDRWMCDVLIFGHVSTFIRSVAKVPKRELFFSLGSIESCSFAIPAQNSNFNLEGVGVMC